MANKELQKLRAKRHYEANKEKYIERAAIWQKENKEKYSEICKKWRVNNKAKKNFYTAQRRAALLRATPLWSETEEIKNVYLEAQYFDMHVDHIIPLKGKNVCGLHVWNNLQLLNKEENLSKSNKHYG